MASGQWVRSLALGGVVAGSFVFTAQPKSTPVGSKVASKPVAVAEKAATSTAGETYLFAVPVPAGVSDKLFAVSYPQGNVKERPVETGWRMAMLAKFPLTVARAVSDERAWTLKDGADWDVTLRSKGGVPYQDVQLVGLFDASHAALLARTDAVVLLNVARSGEVREAYRTGENSAFLRFAASSAWFATFQPGEGIESPPMGPSTLLRIGPDGHATPLVSESNVIVAVVPGEQGQLAYTLDNGTSVAKLDGSRWTGDEKPLFWLDRSTLVLAKGTGVIRLDVVSGVETPWVMLPMVPSAGKKEDVK
jgi:hypothetical protein